MGYRYWQQCLACWHMVTTYTGGWGWVRISQRAWQVCIPLYSHYFMYVQLQPLGCNLIVNYYWLLYCGLRGGGWFPKNYLGFSLGKYLFWGGGGPGLWASYRAQNKFFGFCISLKKVEFQFTQTKIPALLPTLKSGKVIVSSQYLFILLMFLVSIYSVKYLLFCCIKTSQRSRFIMISYVSTCPQTTLLLQ